MDWLQRPLIMLLDVERYQDPWWHPAFLPFSTFYRAALTIWAWSVCACGPRRALCKRPGRGPAEPGLLTVPWHCCLSRKTSVGATERPWTEAVWSAKRMELEKIRLHPRGHCVPRAGPSPLASVLLKGKVRPNDQAKPIRQPAPLLPGNLTGEKSALAVSWCVLKTKLIEKNITVYDSIASL